MARCEVNMLIDADACLRGGRRSLSHSALTACSTNIVQEATHSKPLRTFSLQKTDQLPEGTMAKFIHTPMAFFRGASSLKQQSTQPQWLSNTPIVRWPYQVGLASYIARAESSPLPINHDRHSRQQRPRDRSPTHQLPGARGRRERPDGVVRSINASRAVG